MNERKVSILHASQYGLLSGAVYIIASLVIYFLGYNPVGRHSWLIYWMPIIFIILSVRHYRIKKGGYIGFNDAFVNGFGVGIVSTFLISIYLLILLNVDSSLIPDYVHQNLLMIQKNKEDVVRVQGLKVYQQMVASNNALSIRNIFSDSVIRKLAGQVITSLFVAAYFRKKA